MNKFFTLLLISSITVFSSYKYDGVTTSAVTLAGGIIKAQNTNIEKKYKRKNCPVCKGTGYYISGDKITKVNCGYCEPDSATNPTPKVIKHSPVILNQNCQDGSCKIK